MRGEQTWGIARPGLTKIHFLMGREIPVLVLSSSAAGKSVLPAVSSGLTSLGMTCWAWPTQGLVCRYQVPQNNAFGISLWPLRVFCLSFWAAAPQLRLSLPLVVTAKSKGRRQKLKAVVDQLVRRCAETCGAFLTGSEFSYKWRDGGCGLLENRG